MNRDSHSLETLVNLISNGHGGSKHVISKTSWASYDSDLKKYKYDIRETLKSEKTYFFNSDNKTFFYNPKIKMMVIYDPGHDNLGTAFIADTGFKRFEEYYLKEFTTERNGKFFWKNTDKPSSGRQLRMELWNVGGFAGMKASRSGRAVQTAPHPERSGVRGQREAKAKSANNATSSVLRNSATVCPDSRKGSTGEATPLTLNSSKPVRAWGGSTALFTASGSHSSSQSGLPSTMSDRQTASQGNVKSPSPTEFGKVAASTVADPTRQQVATNAAQKPMLPEAPTYAAVVRTPKQVLERRPLDNRERGSSRHV
jgi:hypothetical protein